MGNISGITHQDDIQFLIRYGQPCHLKSTLQLTILICNSFTFFTFSW